MKSIREYFERIQTLIIELSRVEIERYEEQVFSHERGNLRIRLRFFDNSLLEISEAVLIKEGVFVWLSYRYHYQKADGSTIFRYDNTPHHRGLSTYPDHKHIGKSIVEAEHPNFEQVLDELKKYITLRVLH